MYFAMFWCGFRSCIREDLNSCLKSATLNTLANPKPQTQVRIALPMRVALVRSRTGFLETRMELRYSCAALGPSWQPVREGSENIQTPNTTGSLRHRPAANQIQPCHATLMHDAAIV